MPADYESTARALALPVESPTYEDSPTSPTSPSTRPLSPTWSRPHSSSFRRDTHGRQTSTSSNPRHRRTPSSNSILGRAKSAYYTYMRTYNAMPLRYQIAMSIFGLTTIVLGILFLVYQERLWAALVPRAEAWRERTGGWLLLWFLTLGVAFPPMIGYGTCVTLAGFVYGVKRGWLIAASATILGSTLSFLTSRHLMSSYVTTLLSTSSHATTFTALSSTLSHDGISLLILLRLCPLPYSLSNGAIATLFPPSTVRWPAFAIATAAATPKLLIHVFIGSRVAAIARSGGEMGWRDKCVNYGGILGGMVIGVGTGVVMYRKTKRRAAELEAEGKGGPTGRRPSAGSGSSQRPTRRARGGGGGGFVDDPEAGDDDISLREQGEFDDHDHDEEEEEVEDGDIYHDDLSDDDDDAGDVFEDADVEAGRGQGASALAVAGRGEKP